MTESAQHVVYTGRVLTMVGDAEAQAVEVEGGVITAVGGPEVAEAAQRRGAHVRPAGDGVVLPGFVDAHTHLGHLALGAVGAVDCRVPRIRDVAGLVELLRGEDAVLPAGEVLVGYGNLFYDRKLADGRLPTRYDLDLVSTTRPIIVRAGGHASVLNTAALELAGLMSGAAGAGKTGKAHVVLGDDGSPSGVVSEVDALLPLPRPTAEEIRSALVQTVTEQFTRHGVTTIGEMVDDLVALTTLEELTADGRVAARIVAHLMPSAAPLEEAFRLAADGAVGGGGRVVVRGVKVFADGGYSSRGAAVREPYTPDRMTPAGWRGELNASPESLVELFTAAAAQDVPVAVHVNGERAQDLAVRAWLESGGQARLRLEHAGNWVSDWAGPAAWAAAGVTAVVNPSFLHSYIGSFFPEVVGPSGAAGRMPLRSLLDAGVPLAAGSDAGLGAEDGQTHPLHMLWCLVARRGYHGEPVEPEEAISVMEGLRLLTVDSARALGVDGEVGTIEVGKRADLVVLDSDPRRVPVKALRDIGVTEVLVGGVPALEPVTGP